MNDFMEFVSMSGYGQYVWSAYGLVIGVLLLHVRGCRAQQRRINKSLKTWYKQMAK